MKIECSFDILSWAGGCLYTCTVNSSSISKRGTKVTSCKGVHQTGKSNADVKAIEFINTVVEYFPMGLHKIFPNLKVLRVYNCGLKEVSRRDLMGLENLSTLRLSSNQLKSLPDNLLIGMTKLTRISFFGNKLEFVSSKLLQPIKNNNLIWVDFDGNPTKIGLFQPGSAGSLGSLQELCDNLDKNCKKPLGTRQDPTVDNFPEGLIRGFKGLWSSGLLSDFVIVCESREFKVHRNVLLIQSSVLAAAVETDMQESKTGRMEIVDFSKKAVEDFLKYIYTGETPKETNAMEILALASKYNVPRLQYLMEEIVLDNLDESNAIEILTLANQHNCEFLARAGFNEIQGTFPETDLDPNLIDDPERLKQLTDARSEHGQVLINAKREYEKILTDANRKYEGVLKSCKRNQN